MARLRLLVPVRFSDLDVYGHVNNARLFTLLEEARIKAFWASDRSETGADPELLRAAKVLGGGPLASTRTLVASQRIEYVRPLTWDGRDVHVDLWLGRIGGASMEVCYEVYDADGSLVARAMSVMVTVDADRGTPVRLPDESRASLRVLVEEPIEFRR